MSDNQIGLRFVTDLMMDKPFARKPLTIELNFINGIRSSETVNETIRNMCHKFVSFIDALCTTLAATISPYVTVDVVQRRIRSTELVHKMPQITSYENPLPFLLICEWRRLLNSPLIPISLTNTIK